MKHTHSARTARPQRRRAFTLMEMLVVVAIIVVLAGIGGTYLLGRLVDAKIETTKARAHEIGNALETYFVDNGKYPASLGDLLVVNPQTGKGPYLKNKEYITAPLTGEVYTYDPTGPEGMARNNTVPVPDVYVVNPANGMKIGNFK